MMCFYFVFFSSVFFLHLVNHFCLFASLRFMTIETIKICFSLLFDQIYLSNNPICKMCWSKHQLVKLLRISFESSNELSKIHFIPSIHFSICLSISYSRIAASKCYGDLYHNCMLRKVVTMLSRAILIKIKRINSSEYKDGWFV